MYLILTRSLSTDYKPTISTLKIQATLSVEEKLKHLEEQEMSIKEDNMDLPHSRRAPNTSLLITINALDLLIQIAPFMGTAICARLKVTLLPTALNWRWLESS